MTDEIRTIPPKLTKIEWNALLDHALIVPASYIIYKVDTEYKAKNGLTGKIDYSGTDASTVIQAALDKKGKIFIKNGVYDILTTLQISSQTALEGEVIGYYATPPSTILKLANGANCTLLEAKGEDVGDQSKNIRLENIWFSGNRANQAVAVDMVDLTKGRQVVIESCYFYNSKRDALITYYAWILNSRFMNTGRRAIHAITDCYIKNVNVANAVADSAYAGDHSVWLHSGANMIAFSNVYSSKYGFGITAYGSHYNTIIGNRVSHNNRVGIFLSGATNNIIIGNRVHDNSQHGQNAYPGIDLGGESLDNVVVGNKCWNRDAANLQSYGIRERDTSNYNVIMSNDVKGNYQTHGISYVGVDSRVKDNIGYVTENSGTATITASTTVVFAHGLVGTPTHVAVGFKTTGYGSWIWSADATNITITVVNSGTYNLTWDAEYKP